MPEHLRIAAFLLLVPVVLGAAPSAAQEEAEMISATPADVEGHLGQWVFRVESQQGEFDAEFELRTEDGAVVADVELGPLGRTRIEEIYRTEDGIELLFETSISGQALSMKMPLRFEGETIVGSVGDTSGFLSLDIHGITEAKAQELERAGERRRIRIDPGPQPTERARLELGDEELVVRYDRVDTEEDDFAQIASLDEGVVRFYRHQSTKLFTDLDLSFGDTVVKTRNVADNYPGVYSLWLEKSHDGWNLLFNEKADVWGHQHDPSADAASVPLTFRSDGDESETLGVELVASQSGGTLTIAWGTYRWSADFTTR